MTQAAEKEKPTEKPKSILDEIEAYRESGANMLIPFTRLEPSEFHIPVIDEVYLSIESGDAYKQEDKRKQDDKGKWSTIPMYAISLQGLQKLAVCANVVWHPYETKRTDNRQDRLYVSFQAVGGIRKADGAVISLVGNYDMDFEVIEEELQEQYIKKTKSDEWLKKKKSDVETQNYITSSVRRDMLFKRHHRMKLAESGAKARVIRALLGVKRLYTKEELEKPFIVVRYVFRPPANDPAVRQQLVAASISSMTSVFGPAALNLPPPPQGQMYFPEAIDVDAVHPAPEDVEEPLPEQDMSPPQEPLTWEQWGIATKQERLKEIQRLVGVTKYDLQDYEKRAKCALDKMDEPKLAKLFAFLVQTLEGGHK